MENSDRNINDEILDRMVMQIGELEKRVAKLPDYSAQFEGLYKNFEGFLQQCQYDNYELKNYIGQFKNGNNHYEQIQAAVIESKSILENIRKMLPLKLINTFDHKTKGIMIAGIILLIVVALSTGLSCHLWKENNKLESVNFKYRLAKQVGATVTHWVDSIYLHNPEEARRTLEKMDWDNSAIKNDQKSDQNHKSKKKNKTKKYMSFRIFK